MTGMIYRGRGEERESVPSETVSRRYAQPGTEPVFFPRAIPHDEGLLTRAQRVKNACKASGCILFTALYIAASRPEPLQQQKSTAI